VIRVDAFQRSAEQQGSDIPELIERCLHPSKGKTSLASPQGGPACQSLSPRSARSDRGASVRVTEFGNPEVDRLLSALNAVEYRFWSSLSFAPPTYGADMLGSLFDEVCEVCEVV
jgi:hypothetical protein